MQYVLVDFHTIPDRTAYWFSMYPEQCLERWEGQGLDVHVAIFTLYFPVGTPHPHLRFSAPLNSHGDQLVCSDVRSSFRMDSHSATSHIHVLSNVTHTQRHTYSATTHTQKHHTYSAMSHILRNIPHTCTQRCPQHQVSSASHILSSSEIVVYT